MILRKKWHLVAAALFRGGAVGRSDFAACSLALRSASGEERRVGWDGLGSLDNLRGLAGFP